MEHSPSNLFVSGKEWSAIRRKERANFKRRIVASLERMKWEIPDDMNATEASWKTGENEMLDGAIKAIKQTRI